MSILLPVALLLILIGGAVSVLDVIPNGEDGGSYLDKFIENLGKDSVTTAPDSGGSSNTPEKVESNGKVRLFTSEGWKDIDYDYGKEVRYFDGEFVGYYAPYIYFILEPGEIYDITFNVAGCAVNDNTPYYYDPASETWVAFSSSCNVYSGKMTVHADSDGYVKILPVFGYDFMTKDLDYYESIKKTMEEKGFEINIEIVSGEAEG